MPFGLRRNLRAFLKLLLVLLVVMFVARCMRMAPLRSVLRPSVYKSGFGAVSRSSTLLEFPKPSILSQVRALSTESGRNFHNFRHFASGDRFSRRFADGAAQFTASVAYQPKHRDNKEDSGEFVNSFKRISKGKQTVSATGEDNYVLAYSDRGLLLGVLDGVGGWAEHGYDSSAISRELANHITALYLEEPDQDVKGILDKAYKQVREEDVVDVGSTTAVFGTVDAQTLKLSACNLGDSWFGVFRKNESGHFQCFSQSTEQTYYFNAPYQLSIIPEKMVQEAASRGSKYFMNVPDEADPYTVQLARGDVVIFATDGMTDNVASEDIALYLDDNIGRDLGKVSADLVSKTVKLGKDPHYNSVFSQGLSKITGREYVGGKPDDVTCVMMYIE